MTRPRSAFAPYLAILFTSLFLVGTGISANAQQIDAPSCAASRGRTASLLLADGITTAPHRDLMRLYDMHWYKLDLNLERNSLEVSGTVSLYASSLSNGLTEFAFELHPNFTIQQVLLDGSPCVVRRSGSEVIATLPASRNKQDKLMVEVTYAGRAPSGAGAAIGNGFNTAVAQPWGQQVAWSLSEPFAASEWFPVKQLLSDKADSVEVWVTTDATNKVGSNGVLQRVTPLPNQKHRYEWKSNYPIAYYLISVAVGQYEEYSFRVPLPGASQPVLVQNFIYPQSLPTFKTDIDRTGDFLKVFSELFGLYPFHREKYGHSMAPLGGGMEHQTMTTQSTFEFTLTAHELAHQWWGDEITTAGWSHIWLNEGFASYSEYLALERLLPAERLNWLTQTHVRASNDPRGSVFVNDSTNVARIFSSNLTYRKGAMVLHMLRHALQNDALFFMALQAYRAEYKYKVANTRDFQKVVERVSGRSMGYFFDQWVYGEGYPVFQVAWAQQGDQLYLKSQQSGSSPATPFFTTEVEYRIRTSVKDTVVRVSQNQATETYQIKVPGIVQSIELDPDLWLLKKVQAITNDFSLLPHQQAEAILAYPNPTPGDVFLKNVTGPLEQVSIYDLVGRHIRTFTPNSPFFSIADLARGTYLVRLTVRGEVSQLKILKF